MPLNGILSNSEIGELYVTFFFTTATTKKVKDQTGGLYPQDVGCQPPSRALLINSGKSQQKAELQKDGYEQAGRNCVC